MANPFNEDSNNPFDDTGAVIDSSYPPAQYQEIDHSAYNRENSEQWNGGGQSSTDPIGDVSLRQREAELERREQMLQYRESKLNQKEVQLQQYGQLPNWPRCKPMIYHDIDKDIPEGGRRLVKRVYFAWYISVWVYLINVIANFTLMLAKATAGGGNFGVSLIILFIGTPVSFVFWYQPLYNGIKLDRSMSIFIFFLCYGFHIGITGLFAIGIQGWGGAGFIYVLESLTGGQIVAGIFSIIAFASMVIEVVYGLWQLKAVHFYYRSKDMSVQKAQGEAIATVATSKLGQQIAKESVKQAVQGNNSSRV